MKFRFLIADTINGEMFGTNDAQVARDYSQSYDYFVADADAGVWMTPGDDEPMRARHADEES